MTKVEKRLASSSLSNKAWSRLVKIINKNFKNKCVLDMNEVDDGEFDILEIIHHKATKHTTHKENYWYLITAKNGRLSYITCSILLFGALKVLGKAKHKIVKVK